MEGGSLTGVYAISALTGCGAANGLLSTIAGNGNAIALTFKA